ncbi:unnamed protein product [Rotaria magnacalcarata]|uniref:CS domain-containing protein n=1 Tax=Rotaria magnacalcarata TaxID=392030 RepID=A0A816MWK3_9BILA|nr:unnamed protein product [Rotaria magnacalcarata]CAF2150575.1 unnamed protein product [Rotaria magnacalcarata]CAF4227769.1 unnamed protein product [Rotaria magnacalcarata]CAF4275705.1 unnamed protein product [Rotaria magnacalcarata]
MNAAGDKTKPIVSSFLMQEEGSYKVLVYLSIPGLKLKRSFINFFKFVPSNGHVKVLNFQNESITFMIDLQTKSYSISVARLPEEIQPEHCSIKYQRDGCRIILIKLEPTPWMNIISNDLSPELDIQGDDDQSPTVSAPSRSSQPTRKKVSALVPPPPFNVVPLASSSSSHPTKKRSQHHRYQVIKEPAQIFIDVLPTTIEYLYIFVLRPDSLSLHEEKFYKVYGSDVPIPPEVVENFHEFKSNLISRFRFDKISPFIDFNHFVSAGGSVLMCFLRNATQFINSDLDFFILDTISRNSSIY